MGAIMGDAWSVDYGSHALVLIEGGTPSEIG